MPIERLGNDGFVATGNSIQLFHLVALRGALKLEIIGLRRRGRQASTIIREEMGWTERDKKALLQRLEDYIVSVGKGLAAS